MADIEFEIDGKKIVAKPNQTVIQAADDAGIYIPRFCYHKHLSIAANCRMCLVEVEKSPKALPACATPITPGMKVFTLSQKTIDAQRAVMEFLLINHPLDCPICDQGGECELQDLSMGYGSSLSHYDECKRSVPDQDLGPLIATEMTRCILCTRCVRFGVEVAGLPELGVTYRGEHERITTYVQHAMQSELSGNIIDLCPVGALTNKPYRFTARAWELDQAPSISPHDCVGSNLHIHTRYGKVMRVVGRENNAINETWIADRDRYSYTSLYHPERLEEPMAKIEGEWCAVDWQKAFELAASGLHDAVSAHGADKFAALASPSSTLEEFYLLQKIVRGMGSPHIDHRLREIDTQDQANMGAYPGLGLTLTELENCDAILLIGSHIQKEQPLAGHRVRKAFLKGAQITAVNPYDYAFNFTLQSKKIVAPQAMAEALAQIANALKPGFADVTRDSTAEAIASVLRGKQKVAVLLGGLAMHHPQASSLRYLAQTIAENCGGTMGFLTDGANSAGAWLAGAIPHHHAGGSLLNHPGLNAYQLLQKPRKAYLLLNVEPDVDCANTQHAIEALASAECVIALSMFRNPVLEAHADVILPMAPFTESAGTYVNATGEWQSMKGVAKPFGSSRPAWKILRVLGNYLQLEGFDYKDVEEVKHEAKRLIEKAPPFERRLTEPANFSEAVSQKSTLMRVGEVPLYAIDSLVRRAAPLQETQRIMLGELEVVKLHPKTAEQLNLKEGNIARIKQHAGHVDWKVVLDARVPQDAAYVAGGLIASKVLGDLIGEVEIHGL